MSTKCVLNFSMLITRTTFWSPAKNLTGPRFSPMLQNVPTIQNSILQRVMGGFSSAWRDVSAVFGIKLMKHLLSHVEDIEYGHSNPCHSLIFQGDWGNCPEGDIRKKVIEFTTDEKYGGIEMEVNLVRVSRYTQGHQHLGRIHVH
jgi:hypothetical protein